MNHEGIEVSTAAMEAELERVGSLLRPLFARGEAWQRARRYLRGLTSEVRRKNSLQLAKQLGDATPYGIQHLLGRASWSADALPDSLRSYACEALADSQAVLILDETGFLKKGTKSAGVARRYSGTAGRLENCQIGVFLAYASSQGCALIDRELYLPKAWIEDRPRCREAGIPENRGFSTKLERAQAMLARAIQAGVPFAWVTGDEVYGASTLRRFLEEHGKNYVLAVSRTLKLSRGFSQRTAERLADEIPASRWRTIDLGPGSKGDRRSRFARLEINHDLQPKRNRWLLVRESLEEDRARSYYVAGAPSRTRLRKLAELARSRWRVEQAFEEAKGEVGLDEYEVRSFEGWQRHVTLSLLAHAMLIVLPTRPASRTRPRKKRRIDSPEYSRVETLASELFEPRRAARLGVSSEPLALQPSALCPSVPPPLQTTKTTPGERSTTVVLGRNKIVRIYFLYAFN
ncbi:DDE endonuclease [Planctomycetales bacterium 10988]|nr:DDE endonuclease [Planctomycetales bacterium 10988]